MPVKSCRHCWEFNAHTWAASTHIMHSYLKELTNIYICSFYTCFLLALIQPSWLIGRKSTQLSMYFKFWFLQCCVYTRQLINISNSRWIRLKWNRKQLDISIKGVAFPLGLFCVLYRTINRRSTWHLHHENGLRLKLWCERSGDITPPGRFKCSFSKSYQLSSLLFNVCERIKFDTLVTTRAGVTKRAATEVSARSISLVFCCFVFHPNRFCYFV